MKNSCEPLEVAMEHLPTVVDDISQMYRTNYMGFASFTLLIWDHIDTFTAEVDLIWNGSNRLNPLTILFLVNRYLTPLGFIVNLFAYLSRVWTPEMCSRFIRFEGAMTMIGINIVALMMLLRIYALYRSQKSIIFVVVVILAAQITMNGWLLTKGEAVLHNPASGVQACTMIFDPDISVIASSSAWLPLLYDTVVLLLTLNRTIPSITNKNASYVMVRLFEDGLLYYSAIFATTLVLTIMIIAAPTGLKNIVAQLELLLTVTMMSRITLNLKKSVHRLDQDSQKLHILPAMPRPLSNYHREMQTQDSDAVIDIARPSSCLTDDADSMVGYSGKPRSPSTTGTFHGLRGRRTSTFNGLESIPMTSMKMSGNGSNDLEDGVR